MAQLNCCWFVLTCPSPLPVRKVLAGSIAMAGEAATPGKLRVGVLRRLIGEAGLLERRYRSWTVSALPAMPRCHEASST